MEQNVNSSAGKGAVIVANVDLDALRSQVSRLERGSSPIAGARFATGSRAIDGALGGGLVRAALHEVFADGMASEPAAAAFAIARASKRQVMIPRHHHPRCICHGHCPYCAGNIRNRC